MHRLAPWNIAQADRQPRNPWAGCKQTYQIFRACTVVLWVFTKRNGHRVEDNLDRQSCALHSSVDKSRADDDSDNCQRGELLVWRESQRWRVVSGEGLHEIIRPLVIGVRPHYSLHRLGGCHLELIEGAGRADVGKKPLGGANDSSEPFLGRIGPRSESRRRLEAEVRSVGAVATVYPSQKVLQPIQKILGQFEIDHTLMVPICISRERGEGRRVRPMSS